MTIILKKYENKLMNNSKFMTYGKLNKIEEKSIQKKLFNFKNQILGFYNIEFIKSLGELTEILIKMDFISSKNEGKNFIDKLYSDKIDYGYGILKFKKIQNQNKEEFCKINKYGY